MPSKGDIPAWQQAANLLTHEAWGSHVIRWASAKVPDERLLRADRRPFSITAVSTMHPTWGQTSEQVIEMERLGLAIRSGHTAKASLRTFMKNLGGKPSLRYKATWTDDARVNVQMTKLLREFAGEVEGLGISFSQASWLPDFDGRTPPAWSEMESFHQELNKDGTNEHPRISSSSIAGLLKALGVDPKIDFNTLLQSARNQRSESGAKRNLRAYGGQLGEVLADFLTLKEAQNFWYIIADCGDGARVNHPGKEFCEAWDTLALTLILK